MAAAALTAAVAATTTVLVHGHADGSTATALRPAGTPGTSASAAPRSQDASGTAPAPRTPTWVSGVYAGHGIDTAAVRRFAARRHRSVQIATVYTDRTSWAHFANDLWCVRQYQGFAGRLAIAVPLTLGDTTLQEVASGAADRWFTAYARHLAALGREHPDLRLGWDFNGDWQPWSARNAQDYVAAFRHVAHLLTATLPHATIDWAGNWGPSQAGHDPFTDLYPGDDVVDVVGLDAYDGGWVPARTARQFAAWAASDHGLDAWWRFATRHGKPLALTEWGLLPSGDGDNPAFVRGMFRWLSAHASDLAYEAYFDDGASTLYRGERRTALARAAAEYRDLWSSLR
jgi:hypothetical protein